MKQKSNFHTLCLLLCQRFALTEKQAEKKAHEIIQRGINQFEIENQNIILDFKLKKHLIESLISLIVDRLNNNGDVDSFEDLKIYIYTRDFEKMTEAVLGSTKKELETIPTAKAELKGRSNAQKQADRKYHSSAKGRTSYNKYIHSVKGMESLTKYRQSEKGKETIGRAITKYQKTTKGREAIARAIKKYSETDRGREKRREAVRAYRQRQRDKSILATGGTN